MLKRENFIDREKRMDEIDKKILHILQCEFPITARPFCAIARTVGIMVQDVIERIAKLKTGGVIRQISPIFDSSRIGYQSTLAALKVHESRIEEVAAVLNRHPGVSHNYLREGIFNIWFTLTLSGEDDLKTEIARLASQADVSDWLFLPAIRTFGIGFKLDMGGSEGTISFKHKSQCSGESQVITVNRDFVRELQSDMALVQRPFRLSARKLKMTEGQIAETLRNYQAQGIVRRVAAILRPVQAGYKSNVMVAWAPAMDKVEKLGIFAASLSQVSHCYERPQSSCWPYSVYTMIHGRTLEECRDVIRRIVEAQGVANYEELLTLKEFKKERVRYF